MGRVEARERRGVSSNPFDPKYKSQTADALAAHARKTRGGKKPPTEAARREMNTLIQSKPKKVKA